MPFKNIEKYKAYQKAYHKKNLSKRRDIRRKKSILKYGLSPKTNWKEYQRRQRLDQMQRAPLIRLVATARYRAKKLGYEFNISRHDLFIPKKCPILGIPIKYQKGSRRDNSLSLDRVDPTKGYVKGNVRVISWLANRTKRNVDEKFCKQLLHYFTDNKKRNKK